MLSQFSICGSSSVEEEKSISKRWINCFGESSFFHLSSLPWWLSQFEWENFRLTWKYFYEHNALQNGRINHKAYNTGYDTGWFEMEKKTTKWKSIHLYSTDGGCRLLAFFFFFHCWLLERNSFIRIRYIGISFIAGMCCSQFHFSSNERASAFEIDLIMQKVMKNWR